MKKIISLLILFVVLLFAMSCQVYACDYCNTNEDLLNELHQELLEKKYNNTISNQLFRAGMFQLKSNIDIRPLTRSVVMPSIGEARALVLPIEFADSQPMPEEILNAQYNKFFAPDNPEITDIYNLSVSAYFNRMSYGKLNITGDVLPVYKASENKEYYDSTSGDLQKIDRIYDLVYSALNSYDYVDYSRYDANNDGYVDALYLAFYANGIEFAAYTASFQTIEVSGMKFSVGVVEPIRAATTRTEIHETGHMLGLFDNYYAYGNEGMCLIDYNIEDIMRCSGGYFNMYYKYILGWISEEEGSAIVLTYDDLKNEINLKDIELCAVERYGEETKEKPKAIFFIPDKLLFPFTEFYVAEYRAGGIINNSGYNKTPGIIIWHCNTDINYNRWYIDSGSYIKAVYKSNKSGSGDLFELSKDLYFAGDEFSPDTTPSSNFNNDIYTGAYLKVNSLDSEKASVTAGYKDPIYLTPPNIKIETDKTVVKADDIITYTITYDNYTDIPWTEKYQNRDIGRRNVLINKENSRLEVGRVNTGEMINENQGIVQLNVYGSKGISGWVSMDVGSRNSGKWINSGTRDNFINGVCRWSGA